MIEQLKQQRGAAVEDHVFPGLFWYQVHVHSQQDWDIFCSSGSVRLAVGCLR